MICICFSRTKYVRDYVPPNVARRFQIIKFLQAQTDMPADSAGNVSKVLILTLYEGQ